MAFSDLLTLPYIILALLAVLIFLVSRFFGITKDDSEPPFVPSRIPYFGHLAGILFKRTSYIADLRYVKLCFPACLASRVKLAVALNMLIRFFYWRCQAVGSMLSLLPN